MWTGDQRQVVGVQQAQAAALGWVQLLAALGWVQLLNPNDNWERQSINKAE